MSTKFFTNSENNTLINKFEGLFANNPTIDCFDALIGFLRASGYFKLRPFLNNMKKIRILVGIDADKYIAIANQKGSMFMGIEPSDAKNELLESIRHDIEISDYTQEIENGMLQFIDDIATGKLEVRAHPSKKIHAKIYIMYPHDFSEDVITGGVITGSSNLTGNGLGLTKDQQYEFNVLLRDYDDIKFAQDEFEALWKDAVDCVLTAPDMQKLKEETYLGGDATPYDVYLKMLVEYFGDMVEYNKNDISDLPKEFKRMQYQIDAATEGFNKLLKYNGLFLADVVGLGKTIIATLIAKKFANENGNGNTRILVVYPPAVEKNWKATFRAFGLGNTQFISNGSLNKILDSRNLDYWNAEDFDLILVDESHKFRNNETEMFGALQQICKMPRANKGRVAGFRKKIVLISATPLNNGPEDIYNQIQLFQDARNCALDSVPNLTSFFTPVIIQYKHIIAQKNATEAEKKANLQKLRGLYTQVREKVIKPITIRRTRKDIEAIERYKQEAAAFPKVQPPTVYKYLMDDTLADLFVKTVDFIDCKLNYARYQAIAKLKPEIQKRFYEQAELAAKSLADIIRTLLVKRLESSFEAFKKTLKSFKIANEHMIQMFDSDKVMIAPDLKIEELFAAELSMEDIETKVKEMAETNPKNQIFKASDFVDGFYKELSDDQEILNKLCAAWEMITVDPKFDLFKGKLNELMSKSFNPAQKLVVFSESNDTVQYLTERLNRKDVIAVSGANRGKVFETILANFDENYPEDEKADDYHIIITTDTLAEGVNLHRSNLIVHYDTPWNSTKIMQRIGRVNRIGSKCDKIYNYIFYPSAEGDLFINLVQRSKVKIQGFHTAFGEDNQIYSQEEVVEAADDLKLFDEAINNEESNPELKYLEFIRKINAENPDEIRRIKKLSLRCRCGRTARTIGGRNVSDTSVVYLKSGEKDNFYWVAKDNLGTTHAATLTAVEAMNIYEAESTETAVPRIEEHHIHVKRAKYEFEEESKKAANQTPTEKLGPHAQAARGFVRSLTRHIQGEPRKLELLNTLIELIKLGTIASIAPDLACMAKQCEKKQMRISEMLAKVLETAEKYECYYIEPEEQKREDTLIILSESFAKE